MKHIIEALWPYLPNWFLRWWIRDARMRRHHCHWVNGRCVLPDHR